MKDLSGRVAIVTGAGRGIGRATALELAGRGMAVVVADIGTGVDGAGDDTSVAEDVVREIHQAGGDAAPFTEDVSTWDGAKTAIEASLEHFGRLDAIVNNAGVLRDGMLFKASEEDWDVVMRVHLKHTFAMTRHAAEYWQSEYKSGQRVDARVVNTTSGAGLLGNVGQSNYGAAKAGIAAFTIIAAQELDRYGIRVNAVSPVAATRMTESTGRLSETARERLDPRHVARMTAYLCSPQAGWLTGQVVHVSADRIGRFSGWSITDHVRLRNPENVERTDWQMRQLFGVLPRGVDVSASLG